MDPALSICSVGELNHIPVSFNSETHVRAHSPTLFLHVIVSHFSSTHLSEVRLECPWPAKLTLIESALLKVAAFSVIAAQLRSGPLGEREDFLL